MDCQSPVRGQWGYNSGPISAPSRLSDPTLSAANLPSGVGVGSGGGSSPQGSRGCGRCSLGARESGALPALLTLGLLAVIQGRRRRR
jgi:hypothetical protein